MFQQPYQVIQGNNRFDYKTIHKFSIPQTELFKLQKYDDEHIMFSAPNTKQVVIFNSRNLSQQNGMDWQKIQFSDKPLAIKSIKFNQERFLLAGCHSGSIFVKSTFSERNSIVVGNQWKFNPISADQIFINDILSLEQEPNILLNCYNNGSIAVWGLLTQRRLHTFYGVHDKYTYKLRMQQKNIIVSCGNDSKIVRTDLQKLKKVSKYSHPLPVWCAYPIDRNQIASVGLFGRAAVWDVRSNRIVQFCSTIGHESSFVTSVEKNGIKDREKLCFGSNNFILKWDRRQLRAQLAFNGGLNQSVEALLFEKDKLFACGRGRDLFVLQEWSQSNANESQPPTKNIILKFVGNQDSNLSSEMQQQISGNQAQRILRDMSIEQTIDLPGEQKRALLEKQAHWILQRSGGEHYCDIKQEDEFFIPQAYLPAEKIIDQQIKQKEAQEEEGYQHQSNQIIQQEDLNDKDLYD